LESRRAVKFKCLVSVLVSVVISTASFAAAQQPKKVILVGYVSSGDAASDTNRVEILRMALRERGHVEGQNIAFEYRYGDGKVERAPELVADLMRLQVDIIVVAGGTITIQAAKNATKTIPIVMLARGSDPVEAGLVASLARPGGNVTGLTLLSRELGGKRLELLKEAVPKIARVAVFYDPAFRPSVIDVKDVLPVAARALGLNLHPWEIRSADDFDRVFAAMAKQRPDGLYVPAAGSLIRSNQKRIAGLALKGRLPSVYDDREAVDAGGLMYYGADQGDSFRRVAYYVDKDSEGNQAR
jgi:putative ABC transport system substrate-binding protein